MTNATPSNPEIAALLKRIAELLEAQNANPHRVRAYRTAAERIESTSASLALMVRGDGPQALQALPDIGETLARLIADFVRTGRSDVLEQLQDRASPEKLFVQVPGIGKRLAEEIVRKLAIHSLEALEQAAHDGRLAQMKGIGEKRLRNIQVGLAGMLSHRVHGDERQAPERPSVATLLAVDQAYRRKATAGELHKIAPKRFNPGQEAWLPVMQASQDGWDFRVLYSNTARAHELKKTHDWVVIYYQRPGVEGQATVVTATQGSFAGKRVVRGRERESG